MKLTIVALTLFLLFSSIPANADDLVTLQTRPGAEQRFILIKPENPLASIILFAGGKGTLGLSSLFGLTSINWGKNNFLIRTRDMFAKHGFMVAVVDAPSDRQSKKGMKGGFRTSEMHVEDIDQVINYLRKQADVPVWLIGTSRGTESATHIAINSKHHPDGLVLTSSVSVPDSKGTPVIEMELKNITIPTLVVAHSGDRCRVTPPERAKQIAGMLTNSKKVEIKLFSGGDRPKSKPCQAMSYHGFLGIEDEVVAIIAEFIKSDLETAQIR